MTASSQPKKPAGSSKKKKVPSWALAAAVLVLLVAVMTGVLVGVAHFVADGKLSRGQSVGVIDITGVITDSRPVIQNLVKYREASGVKAILLRIDSPGGGVAASQEIYQEVSRTAQKKPVIASMGSMAASGGLYVAAPATKIVANPATITGSIGVIMQMINIEPLLDKIGVNPVVITSGKYKDAASSVRPMTDEERALLQQMVDRLHDQFVADLAKARDLEEKKVDDYADGRIILGQDALRLGLVDRLGNFEDALDLAARLGDISGRPNIVQEEEEFSWLSFIFGGRNPLSGWAYRVSDRSESPLRFQYLYHPGL